MTQDSGDAFGPGAREPSPQAVSALRASPPIAEYGIVGVCKACRKPAYAHYDPAYRPDPARLIKVGSCAAAEASAIEARRAETHSGSVEDESAAPEGGDAS